MLAPPGSPGGRKRGEERGHAAAYITGIARGPLRSLPKMQADFTMTAIRRFHETADGVVALPGALFLGGVRNLLDEICQQTSIPFLPQQEAIGGQAIATSAASFLVILLDRLGQREMDHGPHCCLIDPQAERYGSDKNALLVRHPALLVAPTLIFFHLAVVSDGGYPPLLQEINRFFDASDGGRIYDDGAVGVAADGVHQQRWLLSIFTLARHVSQIGSMKAGNILCRIA